MSDLSHDAVEFLSSPWSKTFYRLVESSSEDLFMMSPFIGKYPLERISQIISNKRNIHISIVTNLAIDSLVSGSLDIVALLHLARSIPGLTITYLPGLHAKVYVFDKCLAVVTSANLTRGGLTSNHEYGVLLRDPSHVSKIRADVNKYALLGARMDLESLDSLSEITKDAVDVRREVDRSIQSRLRVILDRKVAEANTQLLVSRAKGKTTQRIFRDTIIYLLERHGPMKTTELHPLVQQIHPDLCDDTIDRIIDGVHFGKRWKHHVRNAQQALKRLGTIDFDGQRWFRRA